MTTSSATFPTGRRRPRPIASRQRQRTRLRRIGITSNAINPGPVDTGWMNDDLRAQIASKTPLPRQGAAEDTANLVRYLCSPQGAWINAQLLYSNGGFTSTIS